MYILQKREPSGYFNYDEDQEEFLRGDHMLDRVAQLVSLGEYRITDIRVLKEVEISFEVRTTIKSSLSA